MIDEFTISNFKAFGKKQRIPLKPITLIFGANSSGKSSILQSLIWAKRSFDHGKLDFDALGEPGEETELGGIENVLFRKKRDGRIRFELLLPDELVKDYRVVYEVGLMTREFNETICPKPEPPPEILAYISAGENFLKKEQEANKEILFAPYARDEKGVLLYKDASNSEFLSWWEFRNEKERADNEYREEKQKEWAPVLQELWEIWQNQSRKEGVIENEERFLETEIRPWREYLFREETDPVIFSFEIEIGGKTLVRAEKLTIDDELPLTFVDEKVSEFREFHSSFNLSETPWGTDELTRNWRLTFLGLNPATIRLSKEAVPTPNNGRDPECPPNVIPWPSHEERPDLSLAFPLERLIQDCSRRLKESFRDVFYLGPLRALPPRNLIGFDPRGGISKGAFAWKKLQEDNDLRDIVNHWIGEEKLKSGYQFDSKVVAPIIVVLDSINRATDVFGDELSWDLSKESYRDGLERRPTKVPAPHYSDDPEETVKYWSKEISSSFRSLSLLDTKNSVEVTHRDVGIGISQLIPVVVHAMSQEKSLIAVEQPELHLHPALQARMGDLFIDSALGKRENRFLIETHSEHLILRIMKRIRQSTDDSLPDNIPAIRKEDVCILFVENSEKGATVREMPLTKRGDLAKAWPGGFFEEGLDEMF